MRVISDIEYAAGLKMDLYRPDADGFDLIVWFHGGGLESGCRADGAGLGAAFAAHGFGFVSADYRMYPAARYPDYLLDGAQAVAFMLRQAKAYGGSGRVIVSGQSAGAYMTMLLALNPAFLRNAGADRSAVAAYISDSAQQTTHFNVLRERGEDSRAERIDPAAPLWYVGAERLPAPLLLIAYRDDIPCRPEQNALLCRSVRRFHPDAPIELVLLPGGHCAGSSRPAENGEYPFVTETLRFLHETIEQRTEE